MKAKLRWSEETAAGACTVDPVQALAEAGRGSYFDYHAVPTNARTWTRSGTMSRTFSRRTLRRRSRKDADDVKRIVSSSNTSLPDPSILTSLAIPLPFTHPRVEPHAGKFARTVLCGGRVIDTHIPCVPD